MTNKHEAVREAVESVRVRFTPGENKVSAIGKIGGKWYGVATTAVADTPKEIKLATGKMIEKLESHALLVARDEQEKG